MDCGINTHRDRIGVFSSDFLIHVEQISVSFPDYVNPQALYRVRKIEVGPQASWSHPAPLVTNFFGSTRGNVARGKIAKAWVFAFQIIIAVLFGNRSGRFEASLFGFRHP